MSRIFSAILLFLAIQGFAQATITIDGGSILTVTSNNAIKQDLILDDGTLRMAGAYNLNNIGTLTLSNNSTIDFNGYGARIRFEDSSIKNWDANSILYIEGYTDSSRLIFRNQGLTNQQLSQILFINPNNKSGIFFGVMQDNSQVVPSVVPIPEKNSVLIMLILLTPFIILHQYYDKKNNKKTNSRQ